MAVRAAATTGHRGTVGVGLGVAGVYLAVAVAIWWQVWSGHPSSAMTCGCGDPSLVLWSFRWTAYAVAHGHDPFFSTAMFHPAGVNLLANTSSPLFGFLLLPVTWLSGPVASLNLANTLAPALSAVATYWAVRRGLRVGRLAALVAGLLVELSPAVVGGLAVSHLQTAMLAFLPVFAVCLQELLVRQEGPPWRWGAILAATAVGQFLAGTELLVIAAVFGGAAVLVAAVALGVGLAWGSPTATGRIRHATVGLAVAVGAAGLLLAGPAWFALRGPRHVTGEPHPGLQQLAGSPLSDAVSYSPTSTGGTLLRFVGYLGPIGPTGAYLGVGAVVVAAGAAVVRWRRPAVWALVALAVAAVWLSVGAIWHPFGAPRPAWVPFLPWASLRRLPVVRAVLPQNFSVVTVLAVAGLVALLVDLAWRLGRGRARAIGAGVAAAASAAALVPLVTAWPLPLTAAPISVPRWFTQAAPAMPARPVVLAYPFPGPPGQSEAVVWQAVTGIGFDLAGGCCIVPGPSGAADHGTTPGSANAILGALSSSVNGPRPALTDTAAMATVQAAMRTWGVTMVVVTDRGLDPAYAIQWFTALLGRPPFAADGAHVWTLG